MTSLWRAFDFVDFFGRLVVFFGAKQLKSENQMIKSQRKATSKWNPGFKNPADLFCLVAGNGKFVRSFVACKYSVRISRTCLQHFFKFCNKSLARARMQRFLRAHAGLMLKLSQLNPDLKRGKKST